MAVILITDGEQRAALATVRSLGRAGHEVYVCASRRHTISSASRFSSGSFQVPDPLRDEEGFVVGVLAAATGVAADIVLPITDQATLAVLRHHDRFTGFLIPMADLAAFERASDKAAVAEAAAAVGIDVPLQVQLRAPAEAMELDASALSYPVVVKPTRSVVKESGAQNRVGVRHAADPTELRACLAALSEGAYPVLLQQRVLGPGVGVFLLLWNGTVAAAFSHRRIREKPPAGGVSVLRESVPLEPALLQRSRALLDAFGWQGVAMVEYKIDAASGKPYIMEINGRLWGSLQLAVDAGVDFPAMLVDLALGAHPAPVCTYRTGIRLRWTLGEVDHLLARLRHSNAALSLPRDTPGRGRAVLEFLAALGTPGTREEMLRFRDPRPALRELVEWFARR